MAKIPYQNEILKQQFPEVFNRLISLENFVRDELRTRFHNNKGKEATQINIIEQAKDFGFTELYDELKNDFCLDHADLWAVHEAASYRDNVPDEADRYFEWQEEAQKMWAYEEGRRYEIPERDFHY